MATKNPKNVERRAMVEKMVQEQARKERMRSMTTLGVCVLIVVGLLAAALIPYLKEQQEARERAGKAVEKIGVTESAASCDAIETKPTDEKRNHIPDGTPITYADAPPSFGDHRPQPASFERKFYTTSDRPEVAQLVHNLEHGYTILWYDDTVADENEQLDDIEAIAKKYSDVKFMAAPWTKDDGDAFADGKHIALTRWSADADDPNDNSKQRGNWQYCGATSGKVVADFVNNWSSDEAPEPNGG